MRSVRSLWCNISVQTALRSRAQVLQKSVSSQVLLKIKTTKNIAKDNKLFLNITHTPTSQLLRTMASDKPAMIVEHDPSAKKFFIRLGNEEAKLEYTKRKDTLNLWHTETPPALQGKGIAKVLAQGAFDHAVKNNLKMILTCPYLQKFYADNPKDEYARLVVVKDE